MPISERVLTPRQSELGKIKIGKKSEQKRKAKGSGREWSPPEKLETKDGPFFVITQTTRDKDGGENFVVDHHLMKLLKQYADPDGHLRRIPIMLDSDDVEEIFPSALTRYTGNKRWCVGTGDGANAATRYDQDKPRQVHCPCEWLSSRDDDRCKPGGLLWCTILAGSDTVIGMRHAFRTHGWNSLRSIKGGLLAVKRMVGTMCGVKLWLTVKHHLTRRHDGTWQKVPLVSVMIHAADIPGAQQHAIAAAQRRLTVLQIANNPAVLGLPAPGHGETAAQQADVAQEWFPSESNRPDGVLEEIEDGEIIEYDPETGEVTDGAAEPQSSDPGPDGPPSRRSTEPAVPAQGAPGSSDEKIEAPSKALMERLGFELGELARGRGFDPLNEADFKEGKKAVFQQIVADYVSDQAITFKNLTRKQAELAYSGLQRELAELAERDHQQGDPAGGDPA